MTVQQLLETLLQEHSEFLPAQIVSDLNAAQKEFARETGILETTSNITIVANTFRYTLPTNLSILNKIKYYNASSVEVNGEEVLTWDIDQSTLEFRDYYSEPITAIPSGISTITLFYEKNPTELTLSTITATPDIPSEYHTTLVDKVSLKYHIRKGNLGIANALMASYKSDVQRCKRERRGNKTRTFNIQPTYQAGR